MFKKLKILIKLLITNGSPLLDTKIKIGPLKLANMIDAISTNLNQKKDKLLTLVFKCSPQFPMDSNNVLNTTESAHIS